MGYIIKKSSGGAGGGDATASNQQTQINLQTDSVSLDSVFKDNLGSTVFIAGGKTIGDRVNETFNLLSKTNISSINTIVISFTSTTLSGVAALLETFLQANQINIINISFSSGGVSQHDVLLTYNP